jgi:hypothetical protein
MLENMQLQEEVQQFVEVLETNEAHLAMIDKSPMQGHVHHQEQVVKEQKRNL